MESNCVQLLGRLKKLKRCRIYVLVCGIRSPVICYCGQFDRRVHDCTGLAKMFLIRKKKKTTTTTKTGGCNEFVLLALLESIK